MSNLSNYAIQIIISELIVLALWSTPAVYAETSSPAQGASTSNSGQTPGKLPNAPSMATITKQNPVPEDWEDPAICGGCHTVQYQGWKGSMHSNSFKDPITQAEWALAEKQIGGDISNLCGGCHSPVGMLTKTIKFDPKLGKHGGFTAPPIAENGVFCDVCHTISGTTFQSSEVLEHGNGSYISSPGKVKRGPLKDAKSPYHETAYSDLHTRSDFCGNCHNIFNPINQFPLERTYDEWKYSVYAQNGVQCQDCHMVPVETAMQVADTLKPARNLKDHNLGGKAGIGAAKDRELVHGHGFVGGNTVITAAMGDPDSRRHAEIAIKRLRSAAELDLSLTSVKGQDKLHHLNIKVTNKRAGHEMPTSLTFIREMWLDVRVTDQDGREIFRSGALDSHREVDPDAVMFKAYAVDKDGKPAQYIWTVARFERRTTIPPKGHQYGNYYFNVPKSTRQLKVVAKLNYRSFPQHFVDHLLGKGKLEVPTVSMNHLEVVYEYPKLSVASAVDHHLLSDADKESARLLEAYLGPEQATQDAGKLVKACAACHGDDGVGRTELMPNLAGQNQVYLVSALRAYKSGTRKEGRMNAMTKNLSDEILNQLAAHYSKMTRNQIKQ
ncbi:MAG TPA: cytochrome c family protein [Chromatiales bacterium]|nr:cytochrome c family protein [Chromatiales bacterium]